MLSARVGGCGGSKGMGCVRSGYVLYWYMLCCSLQLACNLQAQQAHYPSPDRLESINHDPLQCGNIYTMH